MQEALGVVERLGVVGQDLAGARGRVLRARGVGPEQLQVVVRTRGCVEEVQDHVDVVEADPRALFHPAARQRLDAVLALEARDDVAGNGLVLTSATTGDQEQVVHVLDERTHIERDHVLAAALATGPDEHLEQGVATQRTGFVPRGLALGTDGGSGVVGVHGRLGHLSKGERG